MNGRRFPPLTTGVIVGSIVIVVGGVLLLKNLGIITARDTLLLWPAVVAIIGLANLTGSGSTATRLWGALLVAVGVYLGLDELGHAPLPLSKIWPVFLIGLGLVLLVRALRGPDAPAAGVAPQDVAVLNEFTMFGGVGRKINSQDFRGGQLFAMFGGHEVDLKLAGIQQGRAVIDAYVMFGGIEISVPPDWSVSAEGFALFGGFSDESVQPKVENPHSLKRLVVRGLAMFGAVEVKN